MSDSEGASSSIEEADSDEGEDAAEAIFDALAAAAEARKTFMRKTGGEDEGALEDDLPENFIVKRYDEATDDLDDTTGGAGQEEPKRKRVCQ